MSLLDAEQAEEKFRLFVKQHLPIIDTEIMKLLPRPEIPPHQLHEAMRHTIIAGGKRLRPTLCMLTAECCGGDAKAALAAGLAIEYIHSYSLIHDDLPALDNDDLRRGHITCHKAFGEATAILAGDALQALAFETLANAYTDDRGIPMLQTFAKAVGCAGLVGGQSLELETQSQGISPDLSLIAKIQDGKTGQLFIASVKLGALAVRANTEKIAALVDYARIFGRLFQLKDDILDITGSVESLGKTPGKDAKSKKITSATLLGLKKAEEEAEKLTLQALSILEPFAAAATTLRGLTYYMLKRQH